ncbi:carboxypeptidase-like regulatory domain-containing protein [Hymenobacter armeniacus]|uniref:Carboxypeptidase-like regulatory domain-containing protein n=1 Tax=Hymenobacter armeniacus TaxID=2771358 RepID=A0ABR8JWB3_9BACT|nr:carboxypeptidase-like regulatory domain-containing protein [Hymenobacter armeniacus]MBD2723206.1 carboxypeptidase-like regulatory domain-containing protein [Hymenobacter armeniacus]
MRLFLLAWAVITVCGVRPALAQSADSRPSSAGSAPERIALSNRPDRSAARPARLMCAPITGQVFDPNGQPLVGATLLIKGTHQTYVTDALGRFQLSDPVYEGQVLDVEAAGYTLQHVALDDCTLPRLVLAPAPDARFRKHGKKAGQVMRLNHRSTNLK